MILFSLPCAANPLSLLGPKDADMSTPEKRLDCRIGVPPSAAQDNALPARAPDGTHIMRFDDGAATIRTPMSGQVDAMRDNQFFITRVGEGAPGKFESTLPLTALSNGVGTRLDETDRNTAVNVLLAESMATDAYKGIHNTRVNRDPPQRPAEMEGLPFTIVQ